MSSQYSFTKNKIDSDDSDSFTLRISSNESENDSLKLAISASDDDNTNSDYYNSATGSGLSSSTIQMDENRSLSPIFNFKMVQRKTVSFQSLSYKLQLCINKVEAYKKNELFSNSENRNENSSSSESELEMNQFKKIGNQTNRELFSSDGDSCSTNERNVMRNSLHSYRILKESDKLKKCKIEVWEPITTLSLK
ncbi:uncharacterized protein LOC131663754 [Phymastichus coffea]|uniref:uncharacterized protein LOC131663754 n=1 Tax=Phymastichus coffea TaxID=108790 RepID=UPI00273C5853|nr:uncharacterized protein LOC131663754 [Phymastichus coffea]